MPAKAGIQNYLKTLDSRLRGNDAKVSLRSDWPPAKAGKLFKPEAVLTPDTSIRPETLHLKP